jgi:tetratricopeptide (TPR) repeat protein
MRYDEPRLVWSILTTRQKSPSDSSRGGGRAQHASTESSKTSTPSDARICGMYTVPRITPLHRMRIYTACRNGSTMLLLAATLTAIARRAAAPLASIDRTPLASNDCTHFSPLPSCIANGASAVGAVTGAWGAGGACGRAQLLLRVLHLRGGSTTRAQMEQQMKAERAKEAEEEERVQALQERKEREREEANRMALVKQEVQDEAMQLARRKRRRLPDMPTLEDLAEYGKDMLAEGDHDEAAQAFARVLDIDPADPNALYNLAVIHQDIHEDMGQAEEMLRKAVDADPAHLEGWMRLAKLHLLRRSELNIYGAYDEELARQRHVSAEQSFRAALALAPTNVQALTGLGSLIWHMKQEDMKQGHMKQDRWGGKEALANDVKLEANDMSEAQDMFSRAVQYNPQTVEGLTVYATFLDKVKKDVSGAYVLYKRAVQLAPDDAHVLSDLASFLRHSARNLTAAERVYSVMHSRSPTDLHVVSEYAEILVESNRSAQAQALFQKVLRVVPDNADLLHMYGDLLLHEMGDTKGASLVFEAAATSDPSHAPTLVTLGEMLVLENKHSEAAEALLSRALLAEPSNSIAAHALGHMVLSRRRPCESPCDIRRGLESRLDNGFESRCDNCRKTLPLAEKYLSTAVEGHPQRSEHAFSYGVFLEQHLHQPRSAQVRDH